MSSFWGETESPQSWRVYDGDGIRDWIAADQTREDCSLSNRLCEECVKTFKSILKQLRRIDYLPKVVCRSLERSGASLILWAEGHGILQGDLDDVLKKSRFLRKSILELLISISQTLIDRFLPSLNLADRNAICVGKLVSAVKDARVAIWVNYASSDILEDSEDDDGEEGDGKLSTTPSARILNNITDDIRFDVECLLDLEPLIKSPFVDPPKLKPVDGKWVPNAPNLRPYFLRISRRFPEARKDLVDRLAKSCWDRFQRIQSEKHQNAVLGEQEFRVEDGASLLALSKPVSHFDASGLGTSLGNKTSHVEMTISYRRNSDTSTSTRIPPLPGEAKKGDRFDCVACGKKIRVTNNSAWKRHLFNDLRPWICHETSCHYGDEPFSSEKDWTQHLALQHGFQNNWRSVHCPLCLESTGDGKMRILNHLATHFEELSLSFSLPGVDSDSESGNEISYTMTTISKGSVQDATGLPNDNEHNFQLFGPEWEPSLDVSPALESIPAGQASSKPDQLRPTSPSTPSLVDSYDGKKSCVSPGLFPPNSSTSVTLRTKGGPNESSNPAATETRLMSPDTDYPSGKHSKLQEDDNLPRPQKCDNPDCRWNRTR